MLRADKTNEAGIRMRIFLRGLVILFLLAIVGGAVFLLTWDVPAPLQRIEKVLPDDRFPA